MSQPISRTDLEELLAPISKEVPAGADLREGYSPAAILSQLRDARSEARAAEQQAETADAEETIAPQWRTVQELATRALKTGSKDLEVAACMTEALVRSAGLQGLADGAALITGLAERYWDDLFPLPDEDGMEPRLRQLAGLAGQADRPVLQPLRKLALFHRPDGTPFALWRYIGSTELSGIVDSERRAARIEAGTVPFEDVEKEALAAGPAHWAAFRSEVAEATRRWDDMDRILTEKIGADSPSTSRVRDLLQLMGGICQRFSPMDTTNISAAETANVMASPDQTTAPVTGATPFYGAPSGAPPADAMAAAIAGREHALQKLGEVARWFRQTEPHSPLSYTLEEAVRRARMTWPELLAEVMPDQPAREALIIALGIRPPQAEE